MTSNGGTGGAATAAAQRALDDLHRVNATALRALQELTGPYARPGDAGMAEAVARMPAEAQAVAAEMLALLALLAPALMATGGAHGG